MPNTQPLEAITRVPIVDKQGNPSLNLVHWFQKIQTQVDKSLTAVGINPNAAVAGSSVTVGAINSKTQNLSATGTLPANNVSGSISGGQVGFTEDNVPDGITRFCIVNGAGLFGVAFVDTNKRALIDFSQVAHLNKILDNINDGVNYQRFKRVASGQTALGVGLIGAGGNNVVSIPATNVLSTDTVVWSFSGAPAAAYLAGSINLLVYVTAGNVNLVQVNPTAGGITPGATSVNWQAIR